MYGNWDADGYIYACAFVAQPKDGLKPVEFAYQAFDTAYEALAGKFTSLKVYLSGKDNWRYGAATILPYKGNRTQPKPEYYQQLRDYVCDKYGAIVVNGMEADDAVGLAQTEDTCIIGTDKDLLQISGNHYHPKHDRHEYINEREAFRNFALQLLTGDSVDNIPGIPGVGPVTAKKILASLSTEVGLFRACRYEWHRHFPSGVDCHDGQRRTTDEAIDEVAKLLWIAHPDGRERWEGPR